MSAARHDAWFQSTAGNGRDEPESLGPLARAAGLVGFALADAGSVAGVGAAAAAAAAAGIAFLPGVSMEAGAEGAAVTIFGFGVDPAAPRLAEMLEARAAARARHAAAVAAKLAAAGVRVAEGAPVTPAALVAAGFAPSRHAARRRYLAVGGVGWVAPETPAAAEVVAALRAAGAVVAVRPGADLLGDGAGELLEHALARLKPAGLAALLACTPAERAALTPPGKRLKLAVVGGSGYRGPGRGPEPGEASTDASGWAALGGG